MKKPKRPMTEAERQHLADVWDCANEVHERFEFERQRDLLKYSDNEAVRAVALAWIRRHWPAFDPEARE